MKISINVAPFVEVYGKVDQKQIQQPQTQLAHKIILESDYLDKKLDKVLKMVNRTAAAQPKAAIQSFTGQLALKLPGHKALKELDLHDRALCKATMARLIIEILTYNGYLTEAMEIRPRMRAGKRSHVEVKYIICGGTKKTRPLMLGLNTEPGKYEATHVNGRAFNGDMKAYFKRKASMKFRVSHWLTEDTVRFGLELSKHFRYVDKDPVQREAKRDRYKALVAHAVSLVGNTYYLPLKPDGRLREYYEFQTLGMRPQGKLWETLMWDQADPEMITDQGADEIRHMIFCLRHGKTPADRVQFIQEDLQWALDQNPFASETEKEFGERLLANKLADALEKYHAKEPCASMFGMDLTNSGLIMASCLFKSIEMASACNLTSDTDQVADSHTRFKEAYGLDITRDQTKEIHTALLHGASAFGTQKQLKEYGIEATDADIQEYNLKAYGACVQNIDALAVWGSQLTDNYRSSVSWDLPDGFRAHHRAYIESVPVAIRCVTPNAKKGWCETSLVMDTPMKYHPDGTVAYGHGWGAGTYSKKGTVPHVRGLYADIIHGFDAFALRSVSNDLMDRDIPHLSKHDDYITHPNYMGGVRQDLKLTFNEIQANDYLDDVLECIAGSGEFIKPEIIYGDWQDEITNGNFLMP